MIMMMMVRRRRRENHAGGACCGSLFAKSVVNEVLRERSIHIHTHTYTHTHTLFTIIESIKQFPPLLNLLFLFAVTLDLVGKKGISRDIHL